MRIRTRDKVIPLSERSTFFVGTYQGNFGNRLNPVYGDMTTEYFQKEYLADETSQGPTLDQHQCIHRKTTPAILSGNSIELTYDGYEDTPSTTCWCDMIRCMPRFGFTAPASFKPNWGGALDELASLASGRVSNACMLPVTLLEAAKTLAMVRNPFNLLKPNSLKKGGKNPALNLVKRATGYWLEGQYGWKSAMYDLETVAKASFHFMNDKTTRAFEESEAERLSVRENFSHTEEAVYTAGCTSAEWAKGLRTNYFNRILFRFSNLRHKATATISCRQDSDARYAINNTRRIFRYAGANNWREWRDVLWEVTPFSFVIDWFVDSRGIWKGLNMRRLRQMDISNVCYSWKRTCTYGVDMQPHYKGYLYQGSAWPWYMKWANQSSNLQTTPCKIPGVHSVYERYLGFPYASLVDATFLSRGLSRLQCLNGAALLLQQIL